MTRQGGAGRPRIVCDYEISAADVDRPGLRELPGDAWPSKTVLERC
ncbi:hypothetical protein [Nocardia puris]